MRDETLLEVVHKLTTDKTFRTLFMTNPKETLAGLGLSPEVYGALVAVIPPALALSTALLVGRVEPQDGSIDWTRGK